MGRGKDLVITGEVEIQIDAIEGIAESAVIGVPNPDFGEGVTSVVVKRPTRKIDEQGIVKALDNRLAKFMLPKKVIFVDDLPRNTMGKVLKNALRQQYERIYSQR